MILYPALDLRDGCCVRLVGAGSGLVERLDPVEQAGKFAALGYRWLHVADLDAAPAPEASNLAALKAIATASKISVQFGGEIPDVKTVETLLSLGIARVVIDAARAKNPFTIKDSCRLFPGRVAVALEASDNQVAMAGSWTGRHDIRVLDLALMFEDYGAAAFIYTDSDSEGGMGGMNVEAISDLAFALTTPVIAAGELSSLADLQSLKAEEESGIAGVICGRALVDGRIDPAEALKLAHAPALAMQID